jgi:hypothetical protein
MPADQSMPSLRGSSLREGRHIRGIIEFPGVKPVVTNINQMHCRLAGPVRAEKFVCCGAENGES